MTCGYYGCAALATHLAWSTLRFETYWPRCTEHLPMLLAVSPTLRVEKLEVEGVKP